MRIVLFLPNLTRNSGGAEVYGLWMAEYLSHNHQVTVLTSLPQKGFNVNDVYDKYGTPRFDTEYVRLWNDLPFRLKWIGDYRRQNVVNHYLNNIDCDLFINGTHGKMLCRGNYKRVHIVHFPAKIGKGLIGKAHDNRYKSNYQMYITNSEFGKYHLERMYSLEGKVITPPVIMPIASFDECRRKENIILAVDRIVPDKKVLEMVMAFKNIFPRLSSYKFVIVGNTDSHETDYYHKVVENSKGYPIEIHTDVSYSELLEWYKRSKIFWHAKGYHVDDNDPIHMEHFGMTTVEAMTNGCIPIVINKAGQKEIMQEKFGYLTWTELDELQDITAQIATDENRISELQPQILEHSKNYQLSTFQEKIDIVMEELF